jgi:hypothetical protein
MSSLRDLWTPIKLINQGVIPSSNGANLQFKTSSGTFWGNGIGWDVNELDPNSITVPAYSPAVFYYTTQTGGSFTVTANTIDTTNYDVNGIITNIPGSGNYATQRIYMSQSGIIRIQYPQNYYSTLAKAIAAIPSETFIENSDNGIDCILIGLLTVKDGVTDLSNTGDAIFTLVSKFGEILGGTAGISTTTLQQAYNNSVNPEIVTNSTLGGVQFRGGTGNDNDKNIIIETNAGVETAWITASGNLSTTGDVSVTGITKTVNFQMTSGATTGYVLTALDSNGNAYWAPAFSATTIDNYVTGGTFSGTTLILNRQNGSVTITGFTATATGGSGTFNGGTVTGSTNFTGGLTANTINTPITNTQVIYSNNGTLSGSTNLTWTNSATTLTINGTLEATSKSFSIPHPTKEGKKLVYGSLEGPENGVYHRGKLQNEDMIVLPEYWYKLVDKDSVTVQLTPIGKHQNLFVKEVFEDKVIVGIEGGLFTNKTINCYYVVYGERKDINKLEVER